MEYGFRKSRAQAGHPSQKARHNARAPELNVLSEAASDWRDPPETPVLSEGFIHLWRARFASIPESGDVGRCGCGESAASPGSSPLPEEALLSEDELAAGRRYLFERDRRLHILRHAFLRRVLAGYGAAAPERLVFVTSEYGKPELVSTASGLSTAGLEGGGKRLRFSLSHTANAAVLAVARGYRVGVDIERIRPDVDALAVLRFVFHPDDEKLYLSLPKGLREVFFFRLWTGFEAFIKARGETVAHDPPGTGLSGKIAEQLLRAKKASRWEGGVARRRDSARDRSRWSLRSVPVFTGFVCAVCAESRAFELSLYNDRVDFPRLC